MQQKFFIDAFGIDGTILPAIPDAADPNGYVSYNQGFTFDYQRDLATDAAAKPILRVNINAALYDITTNIQDYQLNGSPEFITSAQYGSTVPYRQGAIIRYSASGVAPFNTYISITDENTDVPGTTANWVKLNVAPYVYVPPPLAPIPTVRAFVKVTASAGAPAAIPDGTVVPVGSTFAYMEMVAGGGAGGSGGGIGAGAGGAGGGGVKGFFGVTAGQAVTGYAGGGGVTTADGTGGTAAQNSTVSMGGELYATCTPGGGGSLGGSAEVAGSTAFGTVTAAVAGLKTFAGQSGGNGVLVSDLLISGTGGSSMMGAGGLGVITPNVSGANSNGNAPTFVGAGGSGATGNGTGANGSPGEIAIWFF